MELESTYSSYKRYKTNTDAVATWLLTTAKKHGCRAYDTSDSSPAASAAAPRLKGKARKLAKEADAAAAKQAALKPAAYRIEIKDFIQLAQFIAKSTTPQIKVPDHTARDLQQAIKMRKSHQAWLTMISSQTETATAADPTAADQAHTYFIHTLEIVMDILRPNMPEQFRPKPAAGNDADAKGSQLANIFEHLTVEELSEADESVADTRREEAVEKINVIVTDAVEDERSESFIASIYLSRDVHELLNDIQEVWTSYQQGQTSLMAAAITTNTAIEFCRKLQEDYEAAFSQGEKRHERCCLYCIYLEATNGEKRDSRYQSGGCLAPARQVLRSFVGAIERVGPRQAVGASAGHLSLYTRGSDDSAVSDGEKLDQDIDLALGILPEFLALIRATPPVQAEHELFRGLRQLREEKKQPFWLDFAFQVYLDMRHILCEGVDQGFRDMCRETQLIKSSVDRALDFHHEMGVQEPTSGLLRQLSDRITELVERDFVSTIVDMSRFPKDPRTAQHLPPNYHLERDPLWCGLLLYNFKIKAHEGAIFTANSCGFVLATAHLYNSLRATGTLRCEWPDMERIFAMHGVKNLFVGDLPVTFSSSVKSFGLAIGMPVSALAKNTRTRFSDHRSSKPKKSLGTLAPLL
jgi:hypothetical protein